MPVLVVDDYKTMVRIIQNLLSEIGFKSLDGANDGEEAFNKMRLKRYGLVVADWNMTPMSGFDLLRKVRADSEMAKTPFILVTGESRPENVLAAKEAGVNNYVVKPFNAQTLKLKVASVLAPPGEDPRKWWLV
jgi:two-component system chemotaxis response regulator CheY